MVNCCIINVGYSFINIYKGRCSNKQFMPKLSVSEVIVSLKRFCFFKQYLRTLPPRQ